jgi:catechol 2,3-dioxygenase
MTSAFLHTWDDHQSWTVRLVRRDPAGVPVVPAPAD